MDTQYLKMILALPDEFFEGWEYIAGDMAITITSHREVMIISNELISKSKYPGFIKAIYPYSDDDSPEFFKTHQIRPIPSQEQLQKKCIDFENLDKRYTYSNDFSISKRFIALVIEGDLVHDIENKTLKEMWLEFTEYLVYDKIWNGEAWMPADD